MYISRENYDKALRILHDEKLGAYTLSEDERDALGQLMSAWSIERPCPRADADKALAVIGRYQDRRPTPEQVETAGGSKADRFVDMLHVENRPIPSHEKILAAGFRLVSDFGGNRFYDAEDGSRLIVSAGQIRSAPAY